MTIGLENHVWACLGSMAAMASRRFQSPFYDRGLDGYYTPCIIPNACGTIGACDMLWRREDKTRCAQWHSRDVVGVLSRYAMLSSLESCTPYSVSKQKLRYKVCLDVSGRVSMIICKWRALKRRADDETVMISLSPNIRHGQSRILGIVNHSSQAWCTTPDFRRANTWSPGLWLSPYDSAVHVSAQGAVRGPRTCRSGRSVPDRLWTTSIVRSRTFFEDRDTRVSSGPASY